jgi:hypothetical protein
MKTYVALFVSLLLVFSIGPAFAGPIDALKGFFLGHQHQERVVHPKPKPIHRGDKADKGVQPGESPAPNSDASPGPGQSPGPSPTVVESPGPSPENNQAVEGDQSTKPASSPTVPQNSLAQTVPVEIDPPPLF